jgi:uncharacterized membrane protein
MKRNAAARDTVVPQDKSSSEEKKSRGRVLYLLSAALALIGLIDAVYLTAEHYAGADVKCFAVTGCAEVLGSDYATLFGIPISVFGAIAYFAAFSLATLTVFGYTQARSLLFALVSLMFLFTLWLLYVQAFILHRFCSYCLLSAITTISLFAIALVIFRAGRKMFTTEAHGGHRGRR